MKPPNIVLILADYISFGDFGFTGARDIRTPHLDDLARSGVQCTQAVTAAPVCSPARAALLTGRYPARIGLEDNIAHADPEAGLDPSEKTMATLLREQGYRTGIIGKWHLGHSEARDPNAHGFDEFLGFHDWSIDYFRHYQFDGSAGLFKNREPVKYTGYSTDIFTEEACNFIDRHHSDPFFLFVSWNTGLPPHQSPDRPDDLRTPETWEEGTRADYARTIEAMDAGVGRIIDALNQNNLTQDTLVMFTVDHGGGELACPDPFRNGFATLWEGGLRVPLLMSWPERIKKPHICREPAILMDLAATSLAAAGVVPTAPMDGHNLLPMLTGTETLPERSLFWRWARGGIVQRAVRRGRWKYLRNAGMDRLFDVVSDPGEAKDLASAYPEILKTLKKELPDWETSYDPQLPA